MLFPQQRRQQSGIQAAAEKQPHGPISDQLAAHGLAQQACDLAASFLEIPGSGARPGWGQGIGKGLQLPGLASLPLAPVAGRKHLHPRQQRAGGRHRAPKAITGQGLPIQPLPIGKPRRLKGAQLGAEGAAITPALPQQGLHPETIAGQGEPLGFHLPAGHREDAVQPSPEGLPPAAEPLQEHFGVAAGAECRAELLQFLAQLLLVVDLTVEHQGNAVVGAEHRLVPKGGKILDGQAGVQE